MMDRFKNFILCCEEGKIGFGLWILTALCIVFIRDSLECLVGVGIFPIADLFHLFHVPIFFLSLLLAIIILLHFFSGQEIVKVSRASLIFFAVIVLPVLIDFLISLVVKRQVVYQYIMEDVGKNFIQFLNPFFRMSQVPFSLRLEVAIITFFAFIYIFLKRNKVFVSILGAFLVFTLCVFYGSIPAILTGIASFFFHSLIFLSKFIHLNMPPKLTGTVDERIVVILQLLFTLLLAVIWFWRYDPKKARALWMNLRFTRVFHYIILLMMGVTLYFYDVRGDDIFILIKIIGMIFAMFFACEFCAVANDIFDIECDRLSNKDRPLISGILDKSEYLKIGMVYLTFSLLFAIWVSDFCFMITLVFIVLYFVYSAPPFRLKRFYPINPIIIGIQALLAFLLGQLSLTQAESPVPFYPSILWSIFVIFLLGSQIKDLKDIEGDRSCGIYTLPVMLGEDNARKIIASFVLLSYLISPLLFSSLFYTPVIFVLALLLGVANFFYIRRKDSQEKVIFCMYFIYAFILLLFLLKTVFFS